MNEETCNCERYYGCTIRIAHDDQIAEYIKQKTLDRFETWYRYNMRIVGGGKYVEIFPTHTEVLEFIKYLRGDYTDAHSVKKWGIGDKRLVEKLIP